MSKKKRPRKTGHPAREPRHVRRQKMKERFHQPDGTEQNVQALNRRMRQAMHEAPTGDGLVTGPLTVAAEHLVDHLLEAHGLGEEERHAIVHYLVGAWGEVAHAFPDTPRLPGYLEWREHSRSKLPA